MVTGKQTTILEYLYNGYLEKETRHNIIHAGNNHEHRLKENILVDGYYEDENNLKYVYLFHGCFWHGCNRCFVGEKRYNKIEGHGDSFNDRFNKTIELSKRITSLGYILTEIWECEFNEKKRNCSEIKTFIKNHPLIFNDVLNPRDAFYGGRTENIVSVAEVTGAQTINYVDICSLYPYIC